jgi:hypothetical protein
MTDSYLLESSLRIGVSKQLDNAILSIQGRERDGVTGGNGIMYDPRLNIISHHCGTKLLYR